MSPVSRGRRPKSSARGPNPSRGRTGEPAPSGRYTPPTTHLSGFRPGWHKAVGVVLVVVGIGLFVVCESNTWHIHEYGGHVWYVVGLAIAGSSTWWFGAFDPAR